jgi:predicted methyltransferase
MIRPLACVLGALFLGGCDSPDPSVTESSDQGGSIYLAALADQSRPESDRGADPGRKPAEVLEFVGVKPGDHVLEMFAGGGYYTELLSLVVGDQGSVTAHMNTPMVGFVEDEFNARHANDRLANVLVLWAENNELSLEADQYDVATLILNYHDLYWESEQYGWVRVDVPVLLSELYKGLRPGAALGIVDHYAIAGSPADSAGELHRIDPAIVIADIEAAGFELTGRSDMLRNDSDDLSISVFDPSVRGQTDRFVLRFRKPL